MSDLSYAFGMLCRRPPPLYERDLDYLASSTSSRARLVHSWLWPSSSRARAVWHAGSARDGGRYRAGARSRVWRAACTQVDLFILPLVAQWRTPELCIASSRAHALRVLFLSYEGTPKLRVWSAVRVRMCRSVVYRERAVSRNLHMSDI